MHRSLLITLGFIVGIFCSTCYGGSLNPKSEIIALSDAWIRAEVSHDKGKLERVLDDQFLVTLASGKTIDKRAYVESIMSEKIDQFVVVMEAIKIHGNVALVVGVIKEENLKVSWVAVRKGGIWKAISLTLSKVETPK